jgi:tetratricopeptide (TPR) repeat protein
MLAGMRWRFGLRFGVGLVVLSTALTGCTWFRNQVGHCPEKTHHLAERARLAEDAGNIPLAAACLEAALKETPNDPQLHREMARLLIGIDQNQKALAHLEQAVEYDPDDVEANIALSELYIANHQPALAVERLETALHNDPKHTTALLLRAKLAERLCDPQTAIETYHRVLCADPNHVKARVELASLQLEQRQPSLSAPLLRSVCQCSRATPAEAAEARWALGIAYGQENRWNDALGALAMAAEHRAFMSPDDWYRLAYVRGQLGDWEGARRDVYRVLQMNPRHHNAQAMLEVLHGQESLPDAPILRTGHSIKPLPKPELW